MVHVEVLNQAAEEREGQGEAEFLSGRVQGLAGDGTGVQVALHAVSHYEHGDGYYGTSSPAPAVGLRWMIMNAKFCGDGGLSLDTL